MCLVLGGVGGNEGGVGREGGNEGEGRVEVVEGYSRSDETERMYK